MSKRVIERLVPARAAVPDGMAAFLAGVLLLAAPVVAMVASTTAPTERGHWIVVLFGLTLIGYGAVRGIGELS